MFQGGERKKKGVVERKLIYKQWKNYLYSLRFCVQSVFAPENKNYFLGSKDQNSLSVLAKEFFFSQNSFFDKSNAVKDYSYLLCHRENDDCWGFSLLHLCILFRDKKRFLVLLRVASFCQLTDLVAVGGPLSIFSKEACEKSIVNSLETCSKEATKKGETKKKSQPTQDKELEPKNITQDKSSKSKKKKKQKKKNASSSSNACFFSFLEVRDNVGATPLFLAAYVNNAQFVKILLSLGADPNAKTITGCSILGIVLEKGNREDTEVLSMLLKSNLKLDSNTTYTYGGKETNAQEKLVGLYLNTSLHSLVLPSNKSDQTKMVLCSLKNSSCLLKGKYRCSDCLSVKYCSRDHQLADWMEHKKKCQKLKQGRNDLILGVPLLSKKKYLVFPNAFYKLKDKEVPNLQKTFIVKVQIPRPNQKISSNLILIYNKSRSFTCVINSCEISLIKKLRKLVSQGKDRIKLYFRAFLDPQKPDCLNILTKETFDSQNW